MLLLLLHGNVLHGNADKGSVLGHAGHGDVVVMMGEGAKGGWIEGHVGEAGHGVHDEVSVEISIHTAVGDHHVGWARGQQVGSETTLWVKGIHERLHRVAIKDDHVLDGLLRLAQHVDDILRQLASQNRRDGGNLTSQVLQETAQELRLERLTGQSESLVLLRSDLGENLKIVPVARHPAVLKLLEFPKRAETREGGRDALEASLRLGVLVGEGREVAGEEPGRVQLALGDGLDGLGAFLLRGDVDDATGTGFLLGRCSEVTLVTLNDVVVLDQVAEDEAVETM